MDFLEGSTEDPAASEDSPVIASPVPPVDFTLEEIRSRLSSVRGRQYWRSLEELAETPEFVAMLGREFPQHASEWDGGESADSPEIPRADEASLALGGLAACTRQPTEALVPGQQPEEILRPAALFPRFATTLSGYATGLLASRVMRATHEDRGQPRSPREPRRDGRFRAGLDPSPPRPRPFSGHDEARRDPHLERLRRGARRPHEATASLAAEGLAILTGTVTSPTLADQLRTLLTSLPKARWHQWEPAGRDEVRRGALKAFGENVETRYDFSKADVILTLDADPLTFGPGHVRYARDFSRKRRAATSGGGVVTRLHAIEAPPRARNARGPRPTVPARDADARPGSPLNWLRASADRGPDARRTRRITAGAGLKKAGAASWCGASSRRSRFTSSRMPSTALGATGRPSSTDPVAPPRRRLQSLTARQNDLSRKVDTP
jgi:MoCo/4Fe-4S cofactor protein with predicted Tat translocation signal